MMYSEANERRNCPTRNRSVFIVFSDAYQGLTLVRTGLLDALISKYQVIIIAGTVLVQNQIRSHYQSTTITTFLFQDPPPKYLDQVLHRLISCKYEKNAGQFKRRRMNAARSKKHFPANLKSLLLHAIAEMIPEKVLLFVQNHAFSDHSLDRLFKRHRPALTILSWGGAYEPCPMVYRSAKKFGCRTISLDATWDCMDEMTYVPRADRLLVWNESMKKEAVEKHRYDSRRVSAVGLLRCDFYRRKEFWVSRDSFFKEHGLDGRRKLVTLAINRGDPNIYCQVVDMLLKADQEQTLPFPIHIYVRLAPWCKRESFRRISEHHLVKVGTSYRFGEAALVREKEIIDTVNLLQHTDILISVLSTLILESTHFDTPNISLRFPEFKTLYERDFLQPLYETNGVTFVDDMAGLIQAVNRYLDNPQQDALGRKLILQNLCLTGDGKAKTRTLDEIEKIING